MRRPVSASFSRIIGVAAVVAAAMLLPAAVLARATGQPSTSHVAPLAEAGLDIALSTPVNSALLVFAWDVLPDAGAFDFENPPEGITEAGGEIVNHFDHFHYYPAIDFQGIDHVTFASYDGTYSGIFTITVGTPPATPTPSPSPTATPSPTPTESPTPTPSPSPTLTPSPNPTPSIVATPTPSSTPVAMPEMSLADATVAAGGQLSVTVRNLQPGSTATFTLHSQPALLGSASADAAGSIQTTFTLPRDVTSGAHMLVVDGFDASGAPVTLQQPLTVTTVPNTGMPGPVPTLPLFWLGLLALSMASILVMRLGAGE